MFALVAGIRAVCMQEMVFMKCQLRQAIASDKLYMVICFLLLLCFMDHLIIRRTNAAVHIIIIIMQFTSGVGCERGLW